MLLQGRAPPFGARPLRTARIRAEVFVLAKVLLLFENFGEQGRHQQFISPATAVSRWAYATVRNSAATPRFVRTRGITHFSRESNTRCNPGVTASSIAGES
jgi:hypothetical protein